MNRKPVIASYHPVTVYTLEEPDLETLRAGANLTFAEKIEWLERARKKFAEDQEERKKRGLHPIILDCFIET